MYQLFDEFGKFESPTFVLCNIDKTEMFSLGEVYDRKLSLRYNALSDLTFTAPYKVNDQLTPFYNYIDYRRIILVDNIGYFMITELPQNDDGVTTEKKVKAQSLEVELSFKKISLFKGTYKFYDLFDPDNILNAILAYAPTWTVGYVDPSLYSIYRTFDVTDTTAYSFLMNDVEQAYQCIFTFNTFARTINAYSTATATTATDIFLSFDNLAEEMNVQQITNELVTALNVYGGGNLDIRTVNPLGTDTIYNFDYYKNTGWMGQDLINAINAWETKVDANQVPYANLLTDLKDYNDTLLTDESDLAQLNNDLITLEGVVKVKIQQGLDIPRSLLNQIKAKKDEINVKQAAINGLNASIATTGSALAAINYDLSFTNTSNFTSAQLKSLTDFIIGSTYQNPNFIQTDIMTNSEVQEMAQELYNQAQGVLTKVSAPRYQFEINSVNFVFLQEYLKFISQLQLGSTVSVSLKNTFTYSGSMSGSSSGSVIVDDQLIIRPAVLEIDLNYDDPNDFKLILSNRFRLDGSTFEFSDLFGSAQKSGIDTSFNSETWSDWTNNYKDPVSEFITSALDAAKNAVVNATNQEIYINANGLQGRAIPSDSSGSPIPQEGGIPVYDSTGKIIYYTDSYGNTIYSPERVWLINNTLAFTKNNWETASLALGKISGSSYGLSGSVFGLIADAVVGRLIAGNELIITNRNNKFIVDGSGATLTDASLVINSTTGKSRIYLDPNNGIKIQKFFSGSAGWTNQFYVDTNGNVIMSGEVTAFSGTIGGWEIGTVGLYSPNGDNWIESDTGNVQFGNGTFTIEGDVATFNGTINAENVNGIINGGVIGAGIDAANITVGFMSGNRIYAGKITGPGGIEIGIDNVGNAHFRARDTLQFYCSGSVSGSLLPPTIFLYDLGVRGIDVTANMIQFNSIDYSSNGLFTSYLTTRIYPFNSSGSSPIFHSASTLSLDVWGLSNLKGNVDVDGDLSIGGSLIVPGSFNIGGSLTVTGYTIMTGSLSVLSNMSVNGYVNSNAWGHFTGSLLVGGCTVIHGDLQVDGDTNISIAELSTSGNITGSGVINIYGTGAQSNFYSDTVFQNALYVEGLAQFDDSVSFNLSGSSSLAVVYGGNTYFGLTQNVVVVTGDGNKTFHFIDGILTQIE